MIGKKRVKNVVGRLETHAREGMRTRYPALFEALLWPWKPGSDCTLSGMILEHASLQAERDLLKSQAEEEEDIE
ncbi:Hypothetical protein FKW44_013222, partial [Caligus rogercresseyi]